MVCDGWRCVLLHANLHVTCMYVHHTMQTAMQLLEKSVHEKQDTVVLLRKQLEETKAANLKMQTQLKVLLVWYRVALIIT